MKNQTILIFETSSTLLRAYELVLKDYNLISVSNSDDLFMKISELNPDIIFVEEKALSPEEKVALKNIDKTIIYSSRTQLEEEKTINRPFSSEELLKIIEECNKDSEKIQDFEDEFGVDDEPLIVEPVLEEVQENEEVMLLTPEPQENMSKETVSKFGIESPEDLEDLERELLAEDDSEDNFFETTELSPEELPEVVLEKEPQETFESEENEQNSIDFELPKQESFEETVEEILAPSNSVENLNEEMIAPKESVFAEMSEEANENVVEESLEDVLLESKEEVFEESFVEESLKNDILEPKEEVFEENSKDTQSEMKENLQKEEIVSPAEDIFEKNEEKTVENFDLSLDSFSEIQENQPAELKEKKNEGILEFSIDDFSEVDSFEEKNILKPVLSSEIPKEMISKEMVREIIKEELDEIVRSVFWEEAPILIKDVLEKQIQELYGQSQNDK